MSAARINVLRTSSNRFCSINTATQVDEALEMIGIEIAVASVYFRAASPSS